MTLKELQKAAHLLAVRKGWWHQDRNPMELLMLVVTELAEAAEEFRRDKPPIYQIQDGVTILPNNAKWDLKCKPEGPAVELADAIIRICDMAENFGYNLEEAALLKHNYNKSRPKRHGGKKY